MKSDDQLRNIPVIFISALQDTANIVRAFSQGGVDYVTKPFQQEEVQARIATHLGLQQAKKEVELYSHQLEDLVSRKVLEITEAQMAINLALSKLTESRDCDTGKHIERVQFFCKILAHQLKFEEPLRSIIDDPFIDNIFHASPLHDIGKVSIPDSILLKKGKLSVSEFEIMKTHVSAGALTLEAILNLYPSNQFLKMGLEITQYHHERWDGAGYLEGLKGEEIPIAARIMALVDVYDALRSERPYKKPFPHDVSRGIIMNESGSHFDPMIVKAFIEVNDVFERVFEEHQEE